MVDTSKMKVWRVLRDMYTGEPVRVRRYKLEEEFTPGATLDPYYVVAQDELEAMLEAIKKYGKGMMFMSDVTLKRKRGQRGPGKRPSRAMLMVSVRLPADVVDYYKKNYENPTVAMRSVLSANAKLD